MRRAMVLVLAAASSTACGGYPGNAPDDGVGSSTEALCAANVRDMMVDPWGLLKIGKVSINNTKTDFQVSISGVGAWRVEDWHLYVGRGPLPVNRFGWEAPGRFPYQGDGNSAVTVDTSVPLTDLDVECGDALKVAVYAIFVQRDAKGKLIAILPAWAKWDTRFTKRWVGGTIGYSVCCDFDPPPPPELGCVKAPWFYAQTPDAWHVDSVMLGSKVYPKAEMLTIMGLDWIDEGYDISIFLSDYVASTRLNAADGVVLPADVKAALATADAWLDANVDADGRVPYGINKDDNAGVAILPTANFLYDFNTGFGELPFCGANN